MSARDTAPLAIEALNLTKIYGSGNTEVVALNDVTVRVARGEVVALLGPSGAGKSTLLTAVGLINPPTRGRIWIGGELVLEADRACVDLRVFRRRHLGFVFQKANLIPFLSAEENVRIAFGGLETYPVPASPERLAALQEYLGGDEVVIEVDLGIAAGEFTAYGCDLTDGYIRINADYTT